MGFLDRMRSTSSKSEYENGQSELAEAKLKIDDLQSQLNDRERLVSRVLMALLSKALLSNVSAAYTIDHSLWSIVHN